MHPHKLGPVVLALVAIMFTVALAQEKPAPPAPKPAPKPAPAAKGVRTVEMFGTDDMKYSVNEIPAKRGEQLRVVLISKGTMPKVAMAHNFVLLKLGASPVKFIQAGATARPTDFIAPEMKDQVLAATTLAGPGETVEVTFKVPAAAGSYPYVCTFPGHFQVGMRGNLVVK
jgi:azurin